MVSARRRILGWYVAILAIAVMGSPLLQRTLLLSQLEQQVDADLVQEVDELRSLSAGLDPATGEPFSGDASAIFDTFLARNIPSEGEVIFTLVDGRPYKSTVTPAQLLDDPELVALWAAATVTTWGETDSPAGRVRHLTAPLRVGDTTVGTFVVAVFMDTRTTRVDQTVRIGAAVSAAVFLVASAIAWFAAGRVLRPIRSLTEASRSIDYTNWTTRIPVEGDEEVSELARTFNAMLDRLEAAFTTQRRFVDDAGHELRTPITIIRGHVDLLGSDPDEAAEARAIIDDELDRMSRLVDDLLLLARADHGGFITPAPLDVAGFMADIGSKVATLGDRPWSIAVADRIVIVADEQRLTQAIINLAANAVAHTPDGTPIEIGVDREGASIRFWVRDEGAGIAIEDQERIFERFHRGRLGKRSTVGAGLGLAIVAAIAEAHGGSVGVTSTLGAGATFWITIPIDTEEALR